MIGRRVIQSSFCPRIIAFMIFALLPAAVSANGPPPSRIFSIMQEGQDVYITLGLNSGSCDEGCSLRRKQGKKVVNIFSGKNITETEPDYSDNACLDWSIQPEECQSYPACDDPDCESDCGEKSRQLDCRICCEDCDGDGVNECVLNQCTWDHRGCFSEDYYIFKDICVPPGEWLYSVLDPDNIAGGDDEIIQVKDTGDDCLKTDDAEPPSDGGAQQDDAGLDDVEDDAEDESGSDQEGCNINVVSSSSRGVSVALLNAVFLIMMHWFSIFI